MPIYLPDILYYKTPFLKSSYLNNKHHITILGAGLCGLTLAYLLKKKNYRVTVIEARDRLGGRIFTKKTPDQTPIDLGPAWLWNQNTALLSLLKELNIPIYEQLITSDALYESLSDRPPQAFKLPENQEPSYRIAGGTSTLVDQLAASLSTTELKLKEPVLKLEDVDNQIKISTPTANYTTDLVVSTLPPRLLINHVAFTPNLPDSLISVANETHTWMADSIKFGLSYKQPFWKETINTASFFSNTGPFTELYDHTNYKENKFAIAGFMNAALCQESAAYRKEKIVQQLERFFGKEALLFTSYEEQCWSYERYTHVPYTQFLAAHKNNSHTMYNQKFMDNKLIIAGSETASQYAGYMEGAVRRASSVFDLITT
jgi:monoamine oxidase